MTSPLSPAVTMATTIALKTARTTALSRLTRCRNRLTTLMNSAESLTEVKRGVVEYDTLLKGYQAAHLAFVDNLIVTNEIDLAHEEDQKFCKIECEVLGFRKNLGRWVSEAEEKLAEKLTSASDTSTTSRKSSSSTRSVKSAKAHESARVAELRAHQKMLDKQLELEHRKNSILAEEKKLLLSMELEMAEARHQAFAEAEEEAPAVKMGLNPSAPSFEPFSTPPKTLQHRAQMQTPSPASDYGSTSPYAMPLPHPSRYQLDDTLSQHLMPLPRPSHTPLQQQPREPLPRQPAAMYPADTAPSAEHPNAVPSVERLISRMSLPRGEVPVFSGDCTQFHPFMYAFNSRISSRTDDPCDLLYYLLQYMKGEPYEAIIGCLHLPPDVGYAEAVSILHHEYGDPYKISSAYTNLLSQFPPLRADDSSALKALHGLLTRISHAMRNLPDLQVLDHLHNIQMVVKKLPTFMQGKWRERVVKFRPRSPTFSDLQMFVRDISEAQNDPVFGRDALTQSTSAGAPRTAAPKSKQSFATISMKEKCPFCSSTAHALEKCPGFGESSLKDRLTFLKRNKFCFACFNPGHSSKECTASCSCSVCQKRHHTLLHDNNFVWSWRKKAKDLKKRC